MFMIISFLLTSWSAGLRSGGILNNTFINKDIFFFIITRSSFLLYFARRQCCGSGSDKSDSDPKLLSRIRLLKIKMQKKDTILDSTSLIFTKNELYFVHFDLKKENFAKILLKT